MGRPKLIRRELTQEFLRSVLDYNAETGVFTWLRDGSVASAPKDHRGYKRIGIEGQRPYAHRLAFLWMTGSMPQCVDHINCNMGDDRWKNLRGATKAQNGFNRGLQRNNTTGHKGVYYHANGYEAAVWANGKKHDLGRFRTLDDAVNAANAARLRLHGEFARAT